MPKILGQTEAIEQCISMGKKFIFFFDKLFQKQKDLSLKDCITEMEELYLKASNIKLSTADSPLLFGQLHDWFFTAGATPEDFMERPTYYEQKQYYDFEIALIGCKNVSTALKSIKLI